MPRKTITPMAMTSQRRLTVRPRCANDPLSPDVLKPTPGRRSAAGADVDRPREREVGHRGDADDGVGVSLDLAGGDRDVVGLPGGLDVEGERRADPSPADDPPQLVGILDRCAVDRLDQVT